jgi:tetratricopeptide (TPR) repeat protein
LDCLERYEEAIQCYDEAIRIEPEYLHAYYRKAEGLGKLGKATEADKIIKRAKEIEAKESNR